MKRPSEFEGRLKQALTWLEQSGMHRNTYAPLAFRLLWRLGMRVPPPHMNNFVVNAGVMGGFFAVLWGLMMWLLLWSWKGKPFVEMVATSLLSGLLFGLITATLLVIQARRHRVPRWPTFIAN